jgi:hypothetical protein
MQRPVVLAESASMVLIDHSRMLLARASKLPPGPERDRLVTLAHHAELHAQAAGYASSSERHHALRQSGGNDDVTRH